MTDPTIDKAALEALLPCPFCGNDNAMMLKPTCRPETPYNPADRLFPIVRCGSCCAETSGDNEDYRGGSAIAAWNRRAPVAGEVKALVAKFCGDKVNGGMLRDMAYTVWAACHNPTHEDGNTDWGTDTLPIVNTAVEALRHALSALEPVPAAEPVDRDSVLEEAAKAAERIGGVFEQDNHRQASDCAHLVAECIRVLKSGGGK